MSWSCEKVNFDVLKSANGDDDYALHVAAVEWSLADPIVISSKDDIKSHANWRDRFEPYHHQVLNLMRFTRMLPVTLLADDVGLGKTISAGLVLSELMERKRVSRAFVICPAILGPQWVEELASKFGIPAIFSTGKNLTDAIERSAVPVVVTTYDSARSRISDIRPEHFDMLIMDEAHKLRNLHGTEKPPVMAQKVRQALESRIFKFVLMLTATPIQNRVWDLYSLIDLLAVAKGHRNPLGTPGDFRARFIEDKAGRKLNPLMGDHFRAILRQYVVRTRREDAMLAFPSRVVQTRELRGSSTEQQMVELVAGEIEGLGAFVQISLSQAMMSSPQALASQLRNMAERGSVSQTVADKAIRLAETAPMTAKLEGLLTLVRELRKERPRDWRLVVFTLRKETQDAIGRALARENIPVGYIRGGSAVANQSAVEQYRASPPMVNVLVSTDAGAEGINLQAGNVLVNYDLPWNPMIMEQRIGRIQRLASAHAYVMIVNLVVENSIETRVVGRLMEKLQAVSETIGDIETILEATGQDDEDSFEEMVRKLVVSSLKGQNTEVATQKAVASIQSAKTLMQEERRNIDHVFGHGLADAQQEPKPPKFVPVLPSISAEQFVMRALTAEGAILRPRADDTIDVIWSGKADERITFKPEVVERQASGVFMGNAPRLYLPGRPFFERLVQRWLQRSAHSVRDLSSNIEGLTLLTVQRWCESVTGANYESHKIESSKRRMTGDVLCRVKAANGVDSLEKLIRVGPKTDTASLNPDVIANSPVVRESLAADKTFEGIERFIASASTVDADIGEFCKFYEARRSTEIGKAGTDTRQQHKIETDFAPKIFVDVVGMSGLRYDLVLANVSFVLDGKHRYESSLELLPAAQQILTEPQRTKCTVTSRDLPEACISDCAISGKPATSHLLVRSAASGRTALPQFAARCDLTNDILLTDEVYTSDVSGRKARMASFGRSPISSRLGLDDEFVDCNVTGVRVLTDELIKSDVSGQRFRHDQRMTSAVSGKVGHKSEFALCHATGAAILPDEAGESAVSGSRVRRDLLTASQKPPHRLGLKSESVTCSATGWTLLRDEVVECAITGELLDSDVAARSDLSGRFAMPDKVVGCDVTGKLLLVDEVDVSSVSGKTVQRSLLVQSPVSQRKALKEELVRCEITDSFVLPDELIRSDESGRAFRKDQSVTSAETKRIGHESEGVVCCATKETVLASEASTSALTGQSYKKSLLSPSEKSPDRLGLESEFVVCAKCGKRLLLDEAVRSAVSGNWLDRDLVVPSARSRELALPDEMVTCFVTGRHLLPIECKPCSVSGKLVDDSLLMASDLSGKLALEKYFETCEVSGKRALLSELRTCDFTGKRVDPAELQTCSLSRKSVIRYEMVRSDISGMPMLPEYAIWSPNGKRCCTPKEAALCTWRGIPVPRDEVAACKLTGLMFSKDLLTAANELKPLRELLDGKEQGSDANDIVGWLAKSLREQLSGLKSARCVFSPDGTVRAVCAEMRGMLGFKVRHVGVMINEKEARQRIGRLAIGKRNQSAWTIET